MNFLPGRTDIRSRSPGFIASSRSNNVGKGRRQIRSVTSGQGVALKVGSVGLLCETSGSCSWLRWPRLAWTSSENCLWIASVACTFRRVLRPAINDRFRTGTSASVYTTDDVLTETDATSVTTPSNAGLLEPSESEAGVEDAAKTAPPPSIDQDKNNDPTDKKTTRPGVVAVP
jgi:hypothetical protein